MLANLILLQYLETFPDNGNQTQLYFTQVTVTTVTIHIQCDLKSRSSQRWQSYITHFLTSTCCNSLKPAIASPTINTLKTLHHRNYILGCLISIGCVLHYLVGRVPNITCFSVLVIPSLHSCGKYHTLCAQTINFYIHIKTWPSAPPYREI